MRKRCQDHGDRRVRTAVRQRLNNRRLVKPSGTVRIESDDLCKELHALFECYELGRRTFELLIRVDSIR